MLFADMAIQLLIPLQCHWALYAQLCCLFCSSNKQCARLGIDGGKATTLTVTRRGDHTTYRQVSQETPRTSTSHRSKSATRPAWNALARDLTR